MRSAFHTIVLFNIGCSVVAQSFQTDVVLDFITAGGPPSETTDTRTTTAALINKAGLKAEVLKVVTEDGYILRLTRIVNRSLNPGPPVLIVHGLFLAADSWVLRGPKEDLAILLANNGFDVWLADLRGNTFSRKHQTLKTSQQMFWDFSYHEMGVYDLPAFITEILKHSKYRKLFYVGHSMGTTVFAVMASVRPEFNRYIQSAVLLCPVTFGVKQVKSVIFRGILKQSESLRNILNRAGIFDVLRRNNITQALIRATCSKPVLDVCLNIVSDIAGNVRKNTNKEKFGNYVSSIVAGASVKTIHHYTQLYKKDSFKQYDYGAVKNLQFYGNTEPPDYPLHKISSPVVMFYSDNDHFVDEQSVQKLTNFLPNIIHKESIPTYSHLDFLWANDSPKLVYKKIVDILIRESYLEFRKRIC